MSDGDVVLYGMFTPEEFARWMADREPHGSPLIAAMPQPANHTPIGYFSEAVGLLRRHGVLRTFEFYRDLLAVRPRRAADIAALAASHGQEEAVRLATERVHRGERRMLRSTEQPGRGASLKAMHDRQLDAPTSERGDPRRVQVEQLIAALSSSIMASVAPRTEHVMAPRWDSLVLLARTAVLTLMVGVAMVAGYVLGQQFAAQHDEGARLLPPSKHKEADVKGPQAPQGSMMKPSTETEVEPEEPIEEAVSPRARRSSRRGVRAVKPRGSTAINLVKKEAAIPALPERLGSITVAANLAEVLTPRAHPDVSLTMRVLPDGSVDPRGLSLSTVYGRDHALLQRELAGLRFPPTVGGGAFVCYVVADDLPRLECEARGKS